MALRSHHLALIGLGALALAAGGGATWWHLSTQHTYTTTAVTQGPIEQQVLATGNVESPTTVNLAFKGSGKLTALNVTTGQHVTKGEVLASQDASVLNAQLAQAQAQVAAAAAALRTLQSGATSQTVAVYQAQLATAEQTLQNAYASAATTISSAYAKGSDAVENQLAGFFNNGNTSNPTLAFSISDFVVANRIVTERADANTELAAWQQELSTAHPTNASLDQALARADAHATALQQLLNDAVAAASKSTGLSSTQAAAYRTAAATGRTEINAALTSLQTLEHTIALAKAQVNAAQANLNLTTASSTQNSIDAQQAAVVAAQAQVQAIRAQIQDLKLVAPANGVVTNTTGSVGEIIGPSTSVVTLMPEAKLEVKANVSEDNIVNVSVGDPVSIGLDAFPSSTTFSGTVSQIDPAQTIVGGAIYYKTTILFDKNYTGIRPGMTANVWITTASSTNALMVPASALSALTATATVQVLEQGAPVTKTVTTGIMDTHGMVEILSGLTKGEQVVTSS